jgi:hypothetical protein
MAITELAAQRREILDGGNGWQEYDTKRGEEELAKLLAVEAAIVAAPIRNDAEKAMVSAILLETDDRPYFACNFKNALYASLHQRA